MDWFDIFIHGAIAVGAVGTLTAIFNEKLSFFWVLINTIVWPSRELYQHAPDYLEVFAHPQSLLEWTVPVILGVIIAAIIDYYDVPLDTDDHYWREWE